MVADFRKFGLKVISVAFCSMLIGLIFAGSSIFLADQPVFQFVALGVLGGILLATAELTSARKSIAVLGFATFFHLILFPPFGTHLYVRDILFLLGSGGTIILYRFFFYERLHSFHPARPLVLAALLGLNAILVTTILSAILNAILDGNQTPLSAVPGNLSLQFLIGLGLGTGDEISGFQKREWRHVLSILRGTPSRNGPSHP